VVNRPGTIRSAIGNRSATPAQRDEARLRVIKARKDLDTLASKNRQLRDLQTRLSEAKRGKPTISPAEAADAAAAGGFDARWWQVDAELRDVNIPAYDRAAREVAAAEAAADRINAWQGYR
jgi:hypothetical protein